MTDTSKPKRGRGRPPKAIPKIDASPEHVARALFSAVKPADPTLRRGKTAEDVQDEAGIPRVAADGP